MAEYIKREDALKFKDELEPCVCRSELTRTFSIATRDADLVSFLQNLPAEDVRPVVLCKDCSNHGKCITEDTFNLLRIEEPFCCVGSSDMRGGGGNE